MKKLAIVTTHPIQYYAPVFKLLAQNAAIMVYYTWGNTATAKHDPGFGKAINWDIDLLNGYNYTWVKNTAANPGSHHSKGIINPELIGEINSWAPDAILIYGWAYQSHLGVMRHFKGKLPVFFRGDSTLLDEKPGLKSILKKIYLTWVYKHIDHAFYTGQNNKAYFKKYGLQANQLTFAPHAIDNERYAAGSNAEAAVLRQKLNISENNTLILFAGKLEEKKDPLLLLNAFINLNNPDTSLLFVGSGVLEGELKKQAKDYPNIHFIDFQNQSYMPVIYHAADIFCLPSKGPGETWGLAVNEAMACEKAIIVSDKCGCAADLVVNGKNGFIFKSQDLDGLVSALKKLVSDKKSISRYGQQSGLIIEPWSFTNQAEAIKKVLNDINS